jgi:hypothetical protein
VTGFVDAIQALIDGYNDGVSGGDVAAVQFAVQAESFRDAAQGHATAISGALSDLEGHKNTMDIQLETEASEYASNAGYSANLASNTATTAALENSDDFSALKGHVEVASGHAADAQSESDDASGIHTTAVNLKTDEVDPLIATIT